MTKGKSGKELFELGTDAAKWTEALAARLVEMGSETVFDATPGGDLFGWVANMIEAGRSAGYADGEKAGEQRATRETVWSNDGIDVLTVEHIEFKSDANGKVWLNVDGKLVFRAGFASVVAVEVAKTTNNIHKITTTMTPVAIETKGK